MKKTNAFLVQLDLLTCLCPGNHLERKAAPTRRAPVPEIAWTLTLRPLETTEFPELSNCKISVIQVLEILYLSRLMNFNH
jgi:hypothetical protein